MGDDGYEDAKNKVGTAAGVMGRLNSPAASVGVTGAVAGGAAANSLGPQQAGNMASSSGMPLGARDQATATALHDTAAHHVGSALNVNVNLDSGLVSAMWKGSSTGKSVGFSPNLVEVIPSHSVPDYSDGTDVSMDNNELNQATPQETGGDASNFGGVENSAMMNTETLDMSNFADAMGDFTGVRYVVG